MASTSSIREMKTDDPRFEDWIENILGELESADESDDLVQYNQSDHETNSEEELSQSDPENVEVESEQSDSSSDDQILPPKKKKKQNNPRNYYGKNKFKWSAEPPNPNVRTRKHNIISHLPGNIGPAKQLGKYCSHLSSWELLFTQEILDEIILRTNEKLSQIRLKLSASDRHDYTNVSPVEFKAFLGILIYSSVFKSNNEDLEALFATDGTGRDIFRSTISLKRVLVILACLRFDNAADRSERKKTDDTAAISWVFETFIKNCQSCYSIGEYACIDEMLVGFRGRCKFRMYMPNKPRKYGLKILALNDAKTHYFLNAYIYSGKDSDGKTLSEDEKKLPKPTQSVIRLVAPIVGTNRNVTADNWFSSIPLVLELRKRGLTYVGTLRKNKAEVPREFLPSRGKQEKSSLYGFTNELTLVSYVPKKNKTVILISSMHHNQGIDEETEKPEIIAFYNATKGGVDALDEKCTVYSTSRRTNRWPVCIFYTLLNISLVNAYVIFSSFPGNPAQKRLDFIKSLAKELVQPQLNLRLLNSHLPRELRQTIARILDKPMPSNLPKLLEKQVRCGKCPRNKDKKTRFVCTDCSTPICGSCTVGRCLDCSL